MDRRVIRVDIPPAHAGITEDMLVDAFAVHAPTTRPARVPRDRLYVIAGKGDRITPPDHAEALAKHWGTEVLWFDGGHLAQVGRADAVRVVRRSLGAVSWAALAGSSTIWHTTCGVRRGPPMQ